MSARISVSVTVPSAWIARRTTIGSPKRLPRRTISTVSPGKPTNRYFRTTTATVSERHRVTRTRHEHRLVPFMRPAGYHARTNTAAVLRTQETRTIAIPLHPVSIASYSTPRSCYLSRETALAVHPWHVVQCSCRVRRKRETHTPAEEPFPNLPFLPYRPLAGTTTPGRCFPATELDGLDGYCGMVPVGMAPVFAQDPCRSPLAHHRRVAYPEP
jgi:hypothetical protein